MKSPETWKRLIEGKTPLQIAELILADLVGYRKTSLHRATDADALTAVIDAIRADHRGAVGGPR